MDISPRLGPAVSVAVVVVNVGRRQQDNLLGSGHRKNATPTAGAGLFRFEGFRYCFSYFQKPLKGRRFRVKTTEKKGPPFFAP